MHSHTLIATAGVLMLSTAVGTARAQIVPSNPYKLVDGAVSVWDGGILDQDFERILVQDLEPFSEALSLDAAVDEAVATVDCSLACEINSKFIFADGRISGRVSSVPFEEGDQAGISTTHSMMYVDFTPTETVDYTLTYELTATGSSDDQTTWVHLVFWDLDTNELLEVEELFLEEGTTVIATVTGTLPAGGHYQLECQANMAMFTSADLPEEHGELSFAVVMSFDPCADVFEVPMEVDPDESALDLIFEFPGMDPQTVPVHLQGGIDFQVLAGCTDDCGGVIGIQTTGIDFSLLEPTIEVETSDGDTLSLSDVAVSLVMAGPPGPMDDTCSATLPGYTVEIAYEFDGTDQNGSVVLIINACLVFLFCNSDCCYEEYQEGEECLGPMESDTTLTFPMEMPFLLDVGLGEANPTVTVSGLVTTHVVSPCVADLDGSGAGTTFANGETELSGIAIKDLQRNLDNGGSATWFAGGFRISAPAIFTNRPGATFDAQVDEVIWWQTVGPGTFDNQGTFRKSAGPEATDVRVNIRNSGLVEVLSGSLLINRFDYVQTAGSTRVETALEVINGVVDLQGGGLAGHGVVRAHVDNPGGSVRPGSSTGTLTIERGYVQGAGGTLVSEIAGVDDYDALAVAGDAELAGYLTIPRLDGFLPEVGQVFTIVTTTGARNGEFGQVDCPAIYRVDYLDQAVTLTVIQAQPLGDVNCDGNVSFADILLILDAWGDCPEPPEACPADLDGSGVVDFGDILIVLANWS